MKPSRTARTVLAALALAAALSGCRNPFQPATPEQPTGSPVIENFTTPEKLLDTMAEAIMKKGSSGRNAYYNALAESTSTSTPAFYAFHAPAVIDAWHRDYPNPWDLRLEKLFYDYLILVVDNFTYSFVWAEDPTLTDELDESAGTATYHRLYQLEASSADGLTTRTIAVGYADLFMRKLNGRWYLVRWEDRVSPAYGVSDPDHPTMGWRRLDSTSGQ